MKLSQFFEISYEFKRPILYFPFEITNILTKQKELIFHPTSTFKICSLFFALKLIYIYSITTYDIVICIEIYIVLYIETRPTAEVQGGDGIRPCLHRHMRP